MKASTQNFHVWPFKILLLKEISLNEDMQPITAAKWQILLPMETRKRTKNCFAKQINRRITPL